MTSPRSMFTEAIEDHLALKKQNVTLNATMPLPRFDVGDPLDRYPGGPVRPAVGGDGRDQVAAAASATAGGSAAEAVALAPATGATATALADPPVVTGDAGDHRRPLEPLNGMTPMLSLVHDVDEEDPMQLEDIGAGVTTVLELPEEDPAPPTPVLRFPGGVGPRDGDRDLPAPIEPEADADAEATGEQPVIVIDADEPLAPLSPDGPPASIRPLGDKGRRPRFFGLRGRKSRNSEPDGAGWFAEKPRDFSWDD